MNEDDRVQQRCGRGVESRTPEPEPGNLRRMDRAVGWRLVWILGFASTCATEARESDEPEGETGGIMSVGEDDEASSESSSGETSDPTLEVPDMTLPVTSAADDGGDDCGNILVAVIRDFTEEHPDFEGNIGGVEEGLVETQLGDDRKPVYAPAGSTPNNSGADAFAQWYNDVPDVNMRLQTELVFDIVPGGGFLYDNDAFFPIDDEGFGNGPVPSHNYLFTTEIHASFIYRGGEEFVFRGDDDLWIFVNGRLAMDIGGVHGPTERTLLMDERAADLDIEVGQTYEMDIFHAERHTTESNFRVETTIDCFTPIPVG